MGFDRAGQGLASRIFGSDVARLALIKSAWPFAVGRKAHSRRHKAHTDGNEGNDAARARSRLQERK